MSTRQNTVQVPGAVGEKQLRAWQLIQNLIWLPLLGFIAFRAAPRPLLLAGLALSFASLWLVLRCGKFRADWVTLFRFFALLGLAGTAPSQGGPGWIWWSLALLTICSDLLDGWCARRFGGSDAGAVLDMETDQLGTLILASVASGLEAIGAWILLLPAFKYIYALLITAAGRPAHDPKPKEGNNSRGRYVHLYVMTALLTTLAPPTPASLGLALSVGAVIALGWSFSDDALWLLRNPRSALKRRAKT